MTLTKIPPSDYTKYGIDPNEYPGKRIDASITETGFKVINIFQDADPEARSRKVHKLVTDILERRNMPDPVDVIREKQSRISALESDAAKAEAAARATREKIQRIITE